MPKKEPPRRQPWTNGEKDVVLGHFQQHILREKLPGKNEIITLLQRESVLKDRTWSNVKDFVRNYLKNKSKNLHNKLTY